MNKISIMQQSKNHKRLCKVLSVILVAFMCLSSVFMCVSAAATNNWNLITERISENYFYEVGYGGGSNPSWSIIRQRCFLNCKTLVDTFNRYLESPNASSNIVMQLEYFYNNGGSGEAVSYGTEWNVHYSHIVDLVNDTRQLVGYSNSVPQINGKEVTVDQYQGLFNQIQDELNKLTTLGTTVSSSYQVFSSGNSSAMATATGESKNLVNFLWSSLGQVVRSLGFGSNGVTPFLGVSITSDSIRAIAESISAITKTFAYAIAVILFGVNITTTALQNEILTLRGGIKIFARVILVKFWIDLAIPICMYVLNIINSLARQILDSLSSSNNAVFANSSISNLGNNIFGIIAKLVSQIINFLKELLMGLPGLITIIVMAICIIIVMVKLIARCFELTCLVSIAPIFFATLVGEESKRYFRRFISAFLSTAGYIVYVAIVYAVGTQWVTQAGNSQITSLTSFYYSVISTLPRAIIIIACCRVMVKPPKVLLSLTDGG